MTWQNIHRCHPDADAAAQARRRDLHLGRDQSLIRAQIIKSNDDDANVFAFSHADEANPTRSRDLCGRDQTRVRLDPLIRIVQTREHMTWQNIRRCDADADPAAQARSWAGSESGGFG